MSVTAGKLYAVQVSGQDTDNRTDTVAVTYSTTGTLSGTATDKGTGSLMGDFLVQALNSFGTTSRGSTTSAANGTWTTTAPVGDTIVNFTDSSHVYALQYYDRVASSTAATVLPITICEALVGGGRINGVILDDLGAPTPGIRAEIYLALGD